MKPPKQKTGTRRWGWDKVGQMVVKHPLWFAIPIIVVLVLPYIAIPDFTLSANILTQLPRGAESTKGLNVVRDHFPVEQMSPLILLIESKDGSLLNEESLGKIDSAAAKLSNSVEITGVDYYSAPAGNAGTRRQYARALGDAVGHDGLYSTHVFESLDVTAGAGFPVSRIVRVLLLIRLSAA